MLQSTTKKKLTVKECAAKYQNSEMRSSINQCAQLYLQTFCDHPGQSHSSHELIPMNASRGKLIANCFEALCHTPEEKKTRISYQQLIKEVQQQYNFAEYCMGIKFEPWFGDKEPYDSSCTMFADMHENYHLYFLPTISHFGSQTATPDNYMLNITSVFINDYQLSVNDMFRAIHDLFGHAMKGYGFGAVGEEKAWYEHLQFFSPLARPALTTETRGQNSWVNYGPHLRNSQGHVLEKGEPGWIHPSERPFADQKVGLLPAVISGVTMLQKDGLMIAQLLQNWTPNFEQEYLPLSV